MSHKTVTLPKDLSLTTNYYFMFSLFRENVRIALDSIKTQLLRTILTVVIMGIGIWSLVGILSAVKALETNIAGNFASMGSNTFNIQRYEFNL